MRLMTSACCASFWPKTATSGRTQLKSLDTTVQTPRKCPGRDAPQRRRESASSTTAVLASGAYISAAVGMKITSTPSASQSARSRPGSRG